MRKYQSATIEKQFHEYREKWIHDTKYSSSMQLAALHPVYRKIIELGRPVVPYLINDMKSTGTHWFIALSAITDADPILEQHAGDVTSMIQDWVNWNNNQ